MIEIGQPYIFEDNEFAYLKAHISIFARDCKQVYVA